MALELHPALVQDTRPLSAIVAEAIENGWAISFRPDEVYDTCVIRISKPGPSGGWSGESGVSLESIDLDKFDWIAKESERLLQEAREAEGEPCQKSP